MFFGSARVDSRERAERALKTLKARGVRDADEKFETELQEVAEGGRMGPVLRRSARAGAAAHRHGAARCSPKTTASSSRRAAGPGIMEAANRGAREAGRQDDRAEHPPAVRAGGEPVHHRRAAVRVPLLLHAEVLVRVSGEGAGHFSGRVRDVRRAVRDPHARADRQALEEDRGHPVRPRVLGSGAVAQADGRMGRDCRAGSRAAAARGHAGRCVRAAARPSDRPPSRAARPRRSRRRPGIAKTRG